jgi:hypothetical protein
MIKVAFLGMIILLIVAACGKEGTKAPKGIWKMVQMERVDGGKVTNYFSDRYTVSQIKMSSDNHFIFVGKYEVDTITSYRCCFLINNICIIPCIST